MPEIEFQAQIFEKNYHGEGVLCPPHTPPTKVLPLYIKVVPEIEFQAHTFQNFLIVRGYFVILVTTLSVYSIIR